MNCASPLTSSCPRADDASYLFESFRDPSAIQHSLVTSQHRDASRCCAASLDVQPILVTIPLSDTTLPDLAITSTTLTNENVINIPKANKADLTADWVEHDAIMAMREPVLDPNNGPLVTGSTNAADTYADSAKTDVDSIVLTPATVLASVVCGVLAYYAFFR
ncbi:hypothetical protein DFH06DRAFT_1437094 [Mycena polygramma]|nr:hypothetical protein DFH06DRAFT_1350446 [Mycena polygramma]KAJ7634310.1 hypothetical protein DFH06DRAFT_1437094 [Mycena polygramma]